MNMLLAEIQPAQWVLLGVIVLLILCYPIFIVFKNKKEQEKAQQLSNSLKVGKEVLTSSGVYGTIVDIQDKENSKIVTLETGTEGYKSYIAVDVLAIYAVLNPDPIEQPQKENEKAEEVKKEAVEEVHEEKLVEEAKKENAEEKVEEVKEEQVKEVKAKKDKKSKK